ncbi:MAG: SRPBCC domain-containing protein [Pseudomonadota bacterium]
MKTYETEIEIDAPIDVVWHALTVQMPQTPEPFGILRIEGEIAYNARIKLWSEIVPNRAFSLKVETLDGPSKMVWRGGMPLGLFTGTRTFTLTSNSGATRFHMCEIFTGPMSNMITKSMPDLTPSFVKFAQALKLKAETQ